MILRRNLSLKKQTSCSPKITDEVWESCTREAAEWKEQQRELEIEKESMTCIISVESSQ
jgi:hypothetical protein